MRKVFKPLIILSLILLAFILIPVVIFISIDLNNYKQEIETVVQESTGRQLRIEGELNKSIFPWLGVDIGAVSLSNAAGFEAKDFARVKQVQIKVALWPLLQQEIEVNTIILHGLTTNLSVNKKGVSNWDDLAATEATEGKPKEKDDEPVSPPQTDLVSAVAINGIDIRDANVLWDDQQTGTRVEIKDLMVNTGRIQVGQPIDATLSLNANSNLAKAQASIDWQGRLLLQLKEQRYQVTGMKLILAAKGDDVPNKNLALTLAADVDITDNINHLALNNLDLKIDDTSMTGQASVKNFAAPAIRYQLAMDKFNLDRYLPPTTEDGDKSTTKETTTAKQAEPVSLAPLRGLDVQGKLTLDHLTASKLIIENISVDQKLKDGQLQLYPVKARLYGGNVDADIRLDARTNTPKIKVRNTVTAVNVQPVLQALADTDKLSGKVDLSTDISAEGIELPDIKKTLNGTASFIFNDGAIKDFDLGQKVRDAYEKVRNKKLPPSSSPGQTDFAEIKGTATINNGIVTNNDLTAKSPAIRVGGKGTVDLPKETLDYQLNVALVKSAEGQGGQEMAELTSTSIPVRVSGSFSDPKVKVDIKSVLKSKAKEAIDAEKQKAQEKIEQQREEKKQELKEKAADKLKDKLKGLFR